MPKQSKRIDKRIIRSNNALKEAFLELLLEKPYDEISVKDILEKAGYSKPTFYNHYSSKEDFTRKIIDDEIHDLSEAINDYVNEHNSSKWTEKEIADFNEMRFQHIYNRREYYKAFFMYDCFGGFIRKLQTFIDQLYFPQFDLFPFSSNNSYKYFSYMISFVFCGTVNYWVNEDFASSPRRISHLYTYTFYLMDSQENNGKGAVNR